MNPDIENKKLEKLEQIRKRVEDFIKRNTSEYQNIGKKSDNSGTDGNPGAEKSDEKGTASPVFDDSPKTKKRKSRKISNG